MDRVGNEEVRTKPGIKREWRVEWISEYLLRWFWTRGLNE